MSEGTDDRATSRYLDHPTYDVRGALRLGRWSAVRWCVEVRWRCVGDRLREVERGARRRAEEGEVSEGTDEVAMGRYLGHTYDVCGALPLSRWATVRWCAERR